MRTLPSLFHVNNVTIPFRNLIVRKDHLSLMRKKALMSVFILICMTLSELMSACTSIGQRPDATVAVTKYFEALAEKDEVGMVNASCSAWESQARQEFASFAAVTVTLKDLQCLVTSQTDGTAQVSCQGQLIANYGAEDLIIDLSERSYLVVEEGGEWRMCGYQ